MIDRVAAAATLGVGAAVATAALWPAVVSLVPPCPFHAATGLDCPGCGMTRAVMALGRGDLAGALGHNVVAVGLVLPLLAWAWWSWIRSRPVPATFSTRWFLPALLGVMAAFTVARNLPIAAFRPLAA